MKRLFAVVLFAVSAFGQDAATVALDPKADLAAALKSPDALTRATAARVAMIRHKLDLVPQLREALAAEKDPTAAREQIRALVLVGTDEDIDFAAAQRSRFPISIDTDFGEMIGRLGVPHATTLYFKHVAGSRDPLPAVKLSLWGRIGHTSATASHFLAAGHDMGYQAVLSEAAKAGIGIDPAVVLAGLGSESPNIVNDTIWYLVELYAHAPDKLPAEVRERALAPREKASTAEELGRELLRRITGAKASPRPEFAALLRSLPGRALVPDSTVVRRHLTPDETEALESGSRQGAPVMPAGSALASVVRTPEFRLTVLLPKGLPEAILKKKRCGDPWMGVAKATVDRIGRVQALDLGRVGARGGCREALEAMLKLSLADPATIGSPMESANLLQVKPEEQPGCFDELPPVDALVGRGLVAVGGEVTAPKVRRRVEPGFPVTARRAMKAGSVVLTLEAVITRAGCVRDIRLLTQSPWPELNSAAVYALSQWTFDPGTQDGVPVDTIFNLSISFRAN